MSDRDKLTTGDRFDVPASALGLDVPADAPRVDYVVTAVDGDSFQLSVPPGDRGIAIPCAGSCAGVVLQSIPSRVHADDFTADAAPFEPFILRPETTGVWPMLPDKITDTADGRKLFASLTDAQRALYRPSVADGRMGDARTVLPGKPVRYHVGIMLGTPITAPEPDPSQIVGSKIVGVFTSASAPDPRCCPHGYVFVGDDPAIAVVGKASDGCKREPLPIPEPGYYWARLIDGDDWEPVEVRDMDPGRRREISRINFDVCPDSLKWTRYAVLEWGSRLEPPGRVDNLADRLECAESELCRLTHHKRGDGCSIPDCRNYRTEGR